MGRYKALFGWLTGKKAPWHKNKSYHRAGSQGAKILKSLCEGNHVGGREAIILTKSHNAPRRLYYVLKMLRHNNVRYHAVQRFSKSGTPYKVYTLSSQADRTAAEKLVVGKGVMDDLIETIGAIILIPLIFGAIFLFLTPPGWVLLCILVARLTA